MATVTPPFLVNIRDIPDAAPLLQSPLNVVTQIYGVIMWSDAKTMMLVDSSLFLLLRFPRRLKQYSQCHSSKIDGVILSDLLVHFFLTQAAASCE
jgi:hypothetical protein